MTTARSPEPLVPDSSRPFHLLRGEQESPVIVHVPHASRRIPAQERDQLAVLDAALAREVRAMTDHHTDTLAAAAVYGLEPTPHRFVNNTSRLVVDPERLPPGREVLESVGMGAVYTRTHDGHELRKSDEANRARLMKTYFDPYSAAMGDLVEEVLTTHGSCTIVDLHSYPTEPLAYESALGAATRARPDVCLGTDPQHTPADLLDVCRDALTAHGFDTATDTPFNGCYVPDRYLGDERVRSIMIEIRRDSYMDERSGRPHSGASRVSHALRAILAIETSRHLVPRYVASTIEVDGHDPLPMHGWVITAENPGSRRLPPDENADRLEQLKERLAQSGANLRPARAGHGDWWEESFLATNISLETVLTLARDAGQVAVFALREGDVDVVLVADGSTVRSHRVRVRPTRDGHRIDGDDPT